MEKRCGRFLFFMGNCYVIGWDVKIEPGKSWEVSMQWQQPWGGFNGV